MARHLRELPQVAVKSAGWVRLLRCADCGQHWQVDDWDKYQDALAIKIDTPDGWQELNDEKYRLEFIVQNHGGLGDDTCQWHGCANRTLKDMAFCPRCAYENMGLRD